MTRNLQPADRSRQRPEDYPFCVVVADRDPGFVRDVIAQLHALGHQAHGATAHDEALRLAESLLPHVILLGLPAPLARHRELTSNIREVLGLEETYLIAVTEYGPETNRPSSIAAGFDDHLWKPIGPKLLEALMAYLALKLRPQTAVRPDGGCGDGPAAAAAS